MNFQNLVSTDRVVEIKIDGISRWFISLGNTGCNLPANNRKGYATAEAAMAASMRCDKSRTKVSE